jgi:pSer/pThr/pTyr-binding forkhead associated (FHA) protein
MEAALNSPLGRTVLGQTSLTLGRAPDNTLLVNDPQASSHHAEVAPGYGGTSYQITDLNSTNGTFVNEQRLTPNLPHPLSSGDMIRIGSMSFAYEASGASYTPTVAVNAPNYEPTVAAAPPIALDIWQL